MRTKNFIFLLALVILFSLLLIILGPGNTNNITSIQNIANQQFKQIKVSIGVGISNQEGVHCIIPSCRKTFERRRKRSSMSTQSTCSCWASR